MNGVAFDGLVNEESFCLAWPWGNWLSRKSAFYFHDKLTV